MATKLNHGLCSESHTTTYVTWCAAINVVDDTPPEWIELIPAGEKLKALDGRSFRNDSPESVVEAFNADPRDLPVDWEHSSEIRAPKGEEAPAAGWIDKLEVRSGAVWAHVKWTPRGLVSLRGKEYRYISPAFVHDSKKTIKKLVSAGLTNQPAFHLQVMAARAADLAAAWSTAYINDLPDSAFLLIEDGGEKDEDQKTTPRALRHFPYRDADGVVDLAHLRNAISRIPQSEIEGLDADAMAALQTKARKILQSELDKASARTEEHMDPKLVQLLGLAADASIEQVLTAVAAMKAALTEASGKLNVAQNELSTARAQVVPLDKFVPRADFDVATARVKELETSIAAEKKAQLTSAIDTEIKAALVAGKITPATEGYHRAQCAMDGGLERFRDYVKAAPVIGAPSGLEGKKPDGAQPELLTEEQLKIITTCGLTKEAYLASLAK